MTLKKTLQRFAEAELAPLGGAKANLPIEDFQGALKATVKTNRIGFWIAVLMIIALFVIQSYIIISHLDSLDTVKVAVGVMGGSAVGLITLMIKLWKEKYVTEAVLILVPVLKPGEIKTIVNALARKL